MRLIDADKLKNDIERYKKLISIEDDDHTHITRSATIDVCDNIIDTAPTVDPVRHGRWRMQGTAYGCSICQYGVIAPCHNYCPNCGAKMDEVKHEVD